MSTFDGFFKDQFGHSIRADRFTRSGHEASIRIQLLSHVHADHTVGLASNDFSGVVYCSHPTKTILQRTATASERVHYDVHGVKSDDYYTFPNLQQPIFDSRGRRVIKNGKKLRMEVLKPLELNVKHDFSEQYGSPLCITLIDANHCPGAVMFLIESPQTAVLYTGDVRAEPFLINQLAENPCLSEYISRFSAKPDRTLDSIYLDTSAALTKASLLPKAEGVREILNLFDLFPSNTRFFLNAWTFGYEELLRGIAQKYNCKIHMDDYKIRMYTKSDVSDYDHRHSSISQRAPTLADLCTSTFHATRFHACERRWKCPHVRTDNQGCFDSVEHLTIWEERNRKALEAEGILARRGVRPLVVFVNPSEATPLGWKAYKNRIEAACRNAKTGKGAWPSSLLAPLARHSTLPELQELVGLFRPRTLYPNTIYPEAMGADYLSLPRLFGPFLARGGAARLKREAQSYVHNLSRTLPPNVRARLRFLPGHQEDSAPVLDEDSNPDAPLQTVKLGFLSATLGEAFIHDNYDHLEDANDVQALMMHDENDEKGDEVDSDVEIVTATLKQGSVELPEPELPEPKALRNRKAPSQDTGVAEPSAGTTTSGITVPPAGQDNHGSTCTLLSLPNPPTPQASPIARHPDVLQTISSSLVHLASLDGAASKSKCDHFLQGQSFYFSHELVISADSLNEWQETIESHGGIVIRGGRTRQSQETALSCSRLVVCDRREGWEYEKATEQSKVIGNLFWLNLLFNLSVIPDPRSHLLWCPMPPATVKPLWGCVVSTTGFSDNQKAVIETLVDVLGGSYRAELVKKETSILICADDANRKYVTAKDWNINTANILWIEDCYIQLEHLDSDLPLYQDFTPMTHRVGERKIDVAETGSTATDRAPAPPTRTVQDIPPRQPLRAIAPGGANDNARKRAADAASLSPKGPRRATKSMKTVIPGSPELPCPASESFQSASTTYRDDTQQIRNVRDAFKQGLGLPRLRSTEEI